MQTDSKSFDDFMRFASNVPNLADEDRALVVSLLKRMQRNFPELSEPHDVMRCVGTTPTQTHAEKSVIFVRLPYYSAQRMDAARSFKSAYSTRSLLQYFYNLESTRQRDLQQVIRKSGVFPKDHIVHVSELWAVIVNFRLAPIPLMDGASPSLEIVSPPTIQSLSPSNICVINPDQRVFFFPVEHCKTFFAMRDRILRYCLPQIKGRRYELRPYEPTRGYEPRGYEPRSYEPPRAYEPLRAYEAHGYQTSHSYVPRGYEAPHTYESRAYESPRAYGPPGGYEPPRAYETHGYEPRSYEAPRTYEPRAYEPRAYEPPRAYGPPSGYEAPRAYERHPRGYTSHEYGGRGYEGDSYKGYEHEDRHDFKMFTEDKVPIREEDWAKLVASCTSTLLRIHIETSIPGSSEEHRRKEEKSKKRTKPVFFEESSEAGGYDQNPSEADKPAQFEKSHHPLETDEQIQPGIDEDERGPYEASELPDDSQSDWGYQDRNPTLDERRYTGARNRLRRHTSVRSLSPPPGVVINQRPPGDSKSPTHSNIYFGPTTKAAHAEGETYHSHSSTPPECLPGNSSASQNSSPARRSAINLEFPPVFTWQTRKKPSKEESTISKSNTSPDNPSPDHLNSNIQPLNKPIEISNVDEETIKHVSAHIHSELLAPIDGYGWRIYKYATTKSYFDVDQAITERYAMSLPKLIAEHPKDVSDLASPEAAALKDVVIRLCRLFNFFAPLSYPCAVSGKFWGAVHDLLTTIPKYWDSSLMHELANRTGHQRIPRTFLIDIDITDYADIKDDDNLEKIIFSIRRCSKCIASRQYSTRTEAIDHLFTHVHAACPGQQSVNSSQSRWVMSFEENMTYICRKDHRTIIGKLQPFLTSLEKMAAQIQHGVSANGEFDWDTYRIPSSLVDAFQDLLMMVVSSAHLVKSSHEKREMYTGPEPASTFLISSEMVRGVTHVGAEAETSMENAMRDIVLMTYTDEVSDVVTYEAVSPGLVLALIIGDIRCRDSQNNPVNLLEIYRDHVRNLQFKASQNPHRRLLQEIYLVREELEIIQKASERQRLVLTNYLNVINPHSFRVTTESRISSFELENVQLSKLINQLNAELGAISLLNIKLDSLANQTRSGVDVRQEDQGKAILVFTIVTVVFMPLSFVTSYFGMNTNDIRDMDSSQTLFWAISAPLTVGIITVVLVVAFQADRIREAFDAFWAYDSALGAKPSSAVVHGKGKKSHTEKLSGLSPPKNWVATGWSAGRKTELNESMNV
ncbi:Mg2+ transporter protein, CorA-like/Zinc transport protein ZntB [Penicillium griseofulvum]|uniref:Mg2+ transporter protein, CorA-like/Zinc transport protein ZntB n=1 Tax=Penicillium patulum TaxID=5078 RepID=A0A135LQG0_PENPA|nr:Mg2+ transporter protein, CorA-like/Zinc transport protein ZntB [Penicillium griseofulvum]KXG51206.1 Mg2+ transporter protein, CorA-like/Zinc transport protein ZntB [Penicillium griseofulvum]